MKRLIHWVAATALAVTSLSAHAGLFGPDEKEGAKEACFKRHSRAWCTYDAADLSKNLKDLRQADVLKAMKGSSSGPSAETVIDVAMIGATLAGAFTVAPGFTSPGEAAMLALNLLFRTNVPHIAKQNFVFGWMPYEMASSPQEAAEKALEIFDQATLATFKHYSLQSVTIASPLDPRPYSLDRFETLAYTIKGGDCDSSDCSLVGLRQRMADYYAYLRAVEQKAPEWLGGYKAWFISGAPPLELRVNGDYVSQLSAAKLSAQLPAWFFLSATSEATTGNLSATVVVNKGQKLPLLFNQGKAMATIYPEMEIRADPDAELKLVRPKAPASADAPK